MNRATVGVGGSGDQSFMEALGRARAEFMEMPGLQLTVRQAARLWACDQALCEAVLKALVEARFLVRHRELFARA